MTPEDYQVEASRALKPSFYWAPTPPGVEARDYQFAGVEYQINRDNGIFGDEPGVGKTPQGIMLSNAIEAKRTLVLPPASLILNWEREIWKWSNIPNVKTYTVTKSKDGISNEAHYVILSYSMATNPAILDALMDLRWDHMILDEAHYIKDPGGNRRTKAICGWMDHGSYQPGLIDVVGRKTLLTGTLKPNGKPDETYNAIRMLDHGAIDFASLEDFRQEFYGLGEGWVTYRENGAMKRKWSNKVRNVPQNLDKLQHILRSRLMVRRLKKDVMPQLPPKLWVPVALSSTPGIRSALSHQGWKAAERLYEMNPTAFDSEAMFDGTFAEARRLLGEAKAPQVADYIEDMIDSGVQKVVVGAWHISVLAILRERLSKYGLVYMDGKTPLRIRQQAVDMFQGSDKIGIILGQLATIGEGWTLTAAENGVLAEPDPVPGRNDQFLDRMHRYGQTGNVLGHLALIPGSLEERIVGSSILKDQNIHAGLDKRK